MHRTVKALLLPAILLAVPTLSQAQSCYTYASAFSGELYGYGNRQTSYDTTGYVNGSSSHGVNVSYDATYPGLVDNLVVNWSQSSKASASANASAGELHLIAQAQSTVSPSSFTYYDDGGNPIYVPTGLTAVAYSNALGTIIDSVTVTSATLPYGTPVDLKVTTTLDCTVSSPPYGNAEASADVLFYKQYSGSLTDDNGNTYFGFIDRKSSAGLPNGDIEQTSDILHTFVGDTFNVELDAQVSATGDADANRPFGAALADAGNTAFFNLDPVTPGAGYSTGSGLAYTSAVPEPTSLAIIALAALPLTQRRRRSR